MISYVSKALLSQTWTIKMFKLIKTIRYLNTNVLGINKRNQDFIRKLNPKKYRKFADDKLLSKKILAEHEIESPQVFYIIKNELDLNAVNWEKLPKSFVIKPNRGTQGRGIKVFYGKSKKKNGWIAADGKTYTIEDIITHIRDILAGRFSLGHKKDIAYIEERVKIHPVLKPYAYKGIPDIRIIVYKRIPIMAELRLPTREAGGTANLHAGGIAVGIDMASGITTIGIHRKGLDVFGDTYDIIEHTLQKPYLPLRGIQIPHWEKVLRLASRIQKFIPLGYLGVDIVIDRDRGPLILELNARPGLGIQVANQAGLLERIKRVQGIKVKTTTKAVKLARTLFGGEVEEEVEQITGRQIIGLVENIVVFPNPYIKAKKLKPEKIKAKIDTGALHSSIDYRLAVRLGYKFLIDYKNIFARVFDDHKEALAFLKELGQKYPKGERPQGMELFTLIKSGSGFTVRPTIRGHIEIAGEQKDIIFTVANRQALNYGVIIGREDLKGFLIDPTKTFAKSTISL